MDRLLKEQLVRSIFHIRRLNMFLPPELDIRMGEFFLLKGISGHMPCSDSTAHLSDVHSNLKMTKPAVSQMLNTLEKKEYVHREIDKDDRRKISVKMTAKGQSALMQTKEFMDTMMDKTISRFGEDNTRDLINLLTKFADILNDVNCENSPENQKGENELD